MRVLILTNLYPNPRQPHRASFNRQQFRALAADHDVQVIAPIAWTDEWTARRHAGGTSPIPLGRRRECDGMVIHHPRYAFTPKLFRGWYGEFLRRSVRDCFQEAVRAFRPEVVLGCWAYPDGWAAVRLAREAGLPVAVKVHGSDVLTVSNQKARMGRTIEAIRGADAVIAVSRDLAIRAAAMGADPARLHVVYNGVDTSIFQPAPRDAARRLIGITSGDPLILFVGNLVPVKGPDVLIEALASLASAGTPFQCAIVGDGPMDRQLRDRARSLGLGDSVRFLGACPLEKLGHWYCGADLLVLPSRSEGIPNVLLEARACGTPFLASRVGGIPEIVQPHTLVPPSDHAALAQRIQAFLRSPDRPMAAPLMAPGSWGDSARALAEVLRGIAPARSSRVARAA